MWDIWNTILSHLLSWVILYPNKLLLYFLSRKTMYLFIETIYIRVYLIGIIYIVCLTFHLVGTRLEMYMNTLSRFNPSCHLTNGVKLSQLEIVEYPSYNTSSKQKADIFWLNIIGKKVPDRTSPYKKVRYPSYTKSPWDIFLSFPFTFLFKKGKVFNKRC